jgi:DNA topoisomerase-2
MAKSTAGGKKARISGIPKLEDANEAGTRNSEKCTLILTEGDSAKGLAMSGIEVVGRDYYGVFPLKGKLLNVREANPKQIMANEEIQNIIKIMGLQFNKDYDAVKSLRYGSIMIMSDQDTDGSHIKGLVINFIHNFWPSLFKLRGFLKEFITPLLKVSKGSEKISFFTMQDFKAWSNRITNIKSWRIKYYKGLGTSDNKEAKEYFGAINRHRLEFVYTNDEDDKAIDLIFNKKKADDRK